MLRREWGGLLAAVAGGVAIGIVAWVFAPGTAEQPLAVPGGDQEVAWLHTPTSFEAWENFVWAAKRAEMAQPDGPAGLQVDDSGAFPEKTTAIPEIVVRRTGFTGALRIRWYKTTDRMTQEAWVAALAKRDPPPLAVLGGWSSDRAKSLADVMREANWNGPRPLLLLTAATAEIVGPNDDNPPAGIVPPLISLYDRSFRFCFTNGQIAEAVTDFVLSDPTLRPGPIAPTAVRAAGLAAAGGWDWLASLGRESVPAYAIQWQDDPYSTDLSLRFRQALAKRLWEAGTSHEHDMNPCVVPFSTGRLNRPNTGEAAAATLILSHLPPPGTRTVLVIPTVSAPARRTLRTLLQGNPQIGRRVVAVTGDGISVNTFFRDRDFAWPMRSLRIPFVAFAHADPFAWDAPDSGRAPPAGYELAPPKPGELRSTTDDLQHYNRLIRVVAKAAFPDGSGTLAGSADAVAARLHAMDPPFFDRDGDRLPGAGEHVVVLRPSFPEERRAGKSQSEGTLEVYTRRGTGSGWTRLHSLPLGPVGGGNSE